MTNDVEKLILKTNNSKTNLSYIEENTYELYQNIWELILNIKENYKSIEIKFEVDKESNTYNLKDNIKYEIITEKDDKKVGKLYVKRNYLLKTKINIDLLINLLHNDGFNISYLDDMNPILFHIDIIKHNVDRLIKETLIKNKILKLENRM